MTAQQPTPEQDRALRTLEERGTLTAEQASAVRVALWSSAGAATARGASPASVLIEVAGYVGGGLMLGGAGLLIGLNSDRLGRTGTAWALAGYALALALAAVVVAAGPHRIVGLRRDGSPVRRRLVGVLMALASGPAAVAVAVVTEPHATLWAGVAGLAVALASYALLPTIPGVLAIATMSVVTTAGLLELDSAHRHHLPTLAFVGLGVVWGVVSAAGLIRPKLIGYGIGAALAVVGAQLELGADERVVWAYSVTFAVAVACFVIYWLERVTVLLVFGVIATTIAVPEAVTDWTDDALSGPAILLISGAVLVGVSALGLWLRSVRSRAVTL